MSFSKYKHVDCFVPPTANRNKTWHVRFFDWCHGMLPNEDLKGGTKHEMLIFDAPFNGVNALILGYEPWKRASSICI
jgi:hypothetical protein